MCVLNSDSNGKKRMPNIFKTNIGLLKLGTIASLSRKISTSIGTELQSISYAHFFGSMCKLSSFVKNNEDLSIVCALRNDEREDNCNGNIISLTGRFHSKILFKDASGSAEH